MLPVVVTVLMVAVKLHQICYAVWQKAQTGQQTSCLFEGRQ